MLSQGEVPWNPRAEEHSSPIHDDFHREVIAAADADAQAMAEEDQVLMTVQEAADYHQAKATRIFNCLMDLDERTRYKAVPDSGVHQASSSSRNTLADQE